eukprot:CAMPEP_0198224766 /NCGR_PEP_ID=MMETSP1445-20131203/98257_1 /TAXON_ID=36898 /ORGANISM="Pyramimonas sp., Strain CCMP2087" /LENGTH=95 /DNA_ID=CAMNT_0043904049 /DNA_START=1 /DNA_END=285 /DNA_ORIENTATION=+
MESALQTLLQTCQLEFAAGTLIELSQQMQSAAAQVAGDAKRGMTSFVQLVHFVVEERTGADQIARGTAAIMPGICKVLNLLCVHTDKNTAAGCFD